MGKWENAGHTDTADRRTAGRSDFPNLRLSDTGGERRRCFQIPDSLSHSRTMKSTCGLPLRLRSKERSLVEKARRLIVSSMVPVRRHGSVDLVAIQFVKGA